MDLEQYRKLLAYSDLIKDDFTQKRADFERLISILSKFTKSLHDSKHKFEAWEDLIESLLFKYFLHSASLLHLINGTKINLTTIKTKQIYDLPSAYLLSRGCIENYLILSYLYFNKEKSKVKKFRVNVYKLSGLIRKTELFILRDFHKEEKIQLLQKIDVLRGEIQSDDLFNSLGKSYQAKIKNKKPYSASTATWEQLIEMSRLKTIWFRNGWKLSSNYAHSEFISTDQINFMYSGNPEKIWSGLNLILSLNIFCISILLDDLKREFVSARLIYETIDSVLLTKIKNWININE